MIYNKPPLSFDEQADLLISRNFKATKSELIDFLKHNNYYRLTGYLFPFRNSDETFSADINFDKILAVIDYDRELRNILLYALDKIEVSLRTNISHYSSRYFNDPFFYTDPAKLPGIDSGRYRELLESIKKEVERSREEFIHHFRSKYGPEHLFPPVWIAVQVLSFGTLVSMYRGLPDEVKREIAGVYEIPDTVLSSWITGLNSIRNICAHHSRLYNRRLGYKFLLPRQRKYPEWFFPVQIPNGTVFTALTICSHLLKIIDIDEDWRERVKTLFKKYKHISVIKNTFPENWKESSHWKGIINE